MDDTIAPEKALPRFEEVKKKWSWPLDAILISVGKQDLNSLHKATCFQLWALEMLVGSTAILLCKNGHVTIIYHAGPKRLKAFQPLEGASVSLLAISTLAPDAQEIASVAEQMIAKASKESGQASLRIGMVHRTPVTWPFIDALAQELQSKQHTLWPSVGAEAISDVLAPKSQQEVADIQASADVTSSLMLRHFKERVIDFVDQEESVAHSAVCQAVKASGLQLTKDTLGSFADVEELEEGLSVRLQSPSSGSFQCLPPMSGAEHADDKTIAMEGTYLLDVALRFQDLHAFLARTLLILVSQEQVQAYTFAIELHGTVISMLKPGAVLGEIYAAARQAVLTKRPALVDFMASDVGFGIGFELMDTDYLIKADSTRKVVGGTTFCVSIRFSSSAAPFSVPPWAIWIADTVLVPSSGGPPEVLTQKVPIAFTEWSFQDMNDDPQGLLPPPVPQVAAAAVQPAVAAPAPPPAQTVPTPATTATVTPPPAAPAAVPPPTSTKAAEKAKSAPKSKAKAKATAPSSAAAPGVIKQTTKAAEKAAKTAKTDKEKETEKAKQRRTSATTPTPVSNPPRRETRQQKQQHQQQKQQQAARRKVEEPVTRSTIRTRSRAGITKTNEEMREMAQLEEKQRLIRNQKLEELQQRFRESCPESTTGGRANQKLTDYQAYQSPKEMPSMSSRPYKLQVDPQAQALLVPMHGALVPFHISTVRNTVRSTVKPEVAEQEEQHLRINFFFPGQGKTNEDFPVPTANRVFVKELTFRSLARDNLDRINNAIKDIQRQIRNPPSAKSSGNSKNDAKAAGPLQYSKSPFSLREVNIRPVLGAGARRTTCNVEAHINGVRFLARNGEAKIDLLYSQVKNCILQPCEKGGLAVILHFHLHAPMLVGAKMTSDIQVFQECATMTEDLTLKRTANAYDPDEVLEEENERRIKERNNQTFQEFCRHLKGLDVELSRTVMSFMGVPHRTQVRMALTSKSLVAIADWPPFVANFSEVDIVVFERAAMTNREIDMVLVLKDYNEQPIRITTISRSMLNDFKRYLGDRQMPWYQITMSMHWPSVMKEINKDKRQFAEIGGWNAWLTTEGPAGGGGDDSEEESDGGDGDFKPDSSDDDDDDDDFEDGSDFEEESSDEPEDTEDEGETWEEHERRAERADRRRRAEGSPSPAAKRSRHTSRPKRGSRR